MIQSVERACQVLKQLQFSHGISVTEVSKLLDIDKSSASRLLGTLAAHEFLRKASDGTYELGTNFLKVSAAFMDRLDLREAARPYLAELNRETNETAVLYLCTGDEAVCIDKVESPHALNIRAQVGQPTPLYAGATGKAILASMPEDMIERILSQPMTTFTSYTVTEPEEVRHHLEQTRRRGYSVSSEEVDLGTVGIAAPVMDFRGTVTGAVVVVMPKSRCDEDKVKQIGERVVRAADTISQDIGFGGTEVV